MRYVPSLTDLSSPGELLRSGQTAHDQSTPTAPAAPTSSAPSARPPQRWERAAHTVVGLAFGAAAVGNLIAFVPRAGELLPWFAETAWFPPYEWLLDQLLPVAPVVVVTGAAVEGVIAGLLLTRRHVSTGLGLATGWLLGLIPAIGWPYWTPNLVAGVGLALLWLRCLHPRDEGPGPVDRSQEEDNLPAPRTSGGALHHRRIEAPHPRGGAAPSIALGGDESEYHHHH